MNNKQKRLTLESIVAISLALLATPLWGWELKAYTGCTNENRVAVQCLPNISNVESKLNALHEDLVGMKKDKHTWKYARVRPGDNLQFPYQDPLFYASKRHVQSIQYFDITSSDRYIVTSLSDEHTNKAAIQLIKTSGFGSEKKGEGKDFTTDKIVYQRLLTDNEEVAGFNHPGGSQLIGNFLFLALEDFSTSGQPATGVWEIVADPVEPRIWFQYLIPTTDIPPTQDFPDGDIHQATVGVTRLADGTFLLAACAGPDKCDGINFYKSTGTTLDEDPEFVFIYRWNRNDEPPLGLPDTVDNWDDCGPQNMNLVAQDDGTIYLVMFGGEGSDLSCKSGAGYDDHIYGYKLGMDENYEISLEFTNKVDVMPKSYICAEFLLVADAAKELHGLNFLAGSGLWLRPDGRDTIAFLATEHYDTCGANDRYIVSDGVWGEGVKAKTRWGISANWNDEPDLGKELTSGDLVVEIDPTNALDYEFAIAYRGAEQDVVIEDTLPADWVVSNINGDGMGLPLDCGGSTDFSGPGVVVFKGGKAGKKCQSATHLWWTPLELSTSISVGAKTRLIPGKGHQEPYYPPDKCGAFYLNDGAAVYPAIDGMPDFNAVPLYKSNSLCLAAVRDLSAPFGIAPQGSGDEDGDWLSDYDEACVNEFSTNPCLADTDGDGVDDDRDECPLTGDLGHVSRGGCPDPEP